MIEIKKTEETRFPATPIGELLALEHEKTVKSYSDKVTRKEGTKSITIINSWSLKVPEKFIQNLRKVESQHD